MPENTDIRMTFLNIFLIRAQDGYCKDKENVQGLLEIVAIDSLNLIDFNQLSQLNRSFYC